MYLNEITGYFCLLGCLLQAMEKIEGTDRKVKILAYTSTVPVKHVQYSKTILTVSHITN